MVEKAEETAAAPPPGPGGPDEATVKGWVAEAVAEALAGDELDEEEEPEPVKTGKASTARDREAIAEAAARKAVAAIKAQEPAPIKEEPAPVVEPAKKSRFRSAADKFWGNVEEAVKP